MAQIVDVTKSKPIKGESYFVDTNVWFWTTYIPSRKMFLPKQPPDYQVHDYPDFLERALNGGARLCHCSLTLAELANIIENTELAIYKNKTGKELEKKEFRKIGPSRESVLKEIAMAWETVNKMSTCLDVPLDLRFANESQRIMAEGEVDPFDAFLIQTMRRNKIDYIITDDYDFCAIGKQIVVTANAKALKHG